MRRTPHAACVRACTCTRGQLAGQSGSEHLSILESYSNNLEGIGIFHLVVCPLHSVLLLLVLIIFFLSAAFLSKSALFHAPLLLHHIFTYFLVSHLDSLDLFPRTLLARACNVVFKEFINSHSTHLPATIRYDLSYLLAHREPSIIFSSHPSFLHRVVFHKIKTVVSIRYLTLAFPAHFFLQEPRSYSYHLTVALRYCTFSSHTFTDPPIFSPHLCPPSQLDLNSSSSLPPSSDLLI